MMNINPLTLADLSSVARIQQECYPADFLESEGSFANKITGCADFSFMASSQGSALGYVVALPWLFGQILDLDGTQYQLPQHPDCLYIHDLAVSTQARSQGVAEHLLSSVFQQAETEGYQRLGLVAVQGAASYWQRQGFKEKQGNAEFQRYLATYGDDAVYMVL